MKHFYYLLFSFAILTSCTEKNPLDDADVRTGDIQTKSVTVNPKFNCLGWGYDITGDLMNYKQVKSPVIDIEKYDLDFPKEIVINQPYQQSDKFTYGSNAEDYIEKINISDSLKGSKDDFSGTITSNFTSKSSYSSQYSWISYEKQNVISHVHFSATNEKLQNYLTEGFSNDLKTLSANDIIIKYGTHVLTDITLGGKISFLYRTFALNIDKEKTTKAGFEAAINKFSLNAGLEKNTTLATKNKEQYLVVQTIGGTSGIISKIDLEKGIPELDINNWQQTVNSNTAGVIDADWDNMIPIYELVSDPTKKAELKEAIEIYIESKRIDMLTPLYRYFRGDKWKDHLYTTDINELGFNDDKYKYEGIECYVYTEQKNNTVPLYRYFRGDKWKDHLYTTNINELGLYNRFYKYEGIACYVFNTNASKTVPVRRYFSDDYTDHIYISGNLGDHLNTSDWKSEGIAFYAYMN